MTHIYFVTRGMVVEKNGDVDMKAPKFNHKTGDILGLQYLNPAFGNCAIANAYCHHSSDAAVIPLEISKVRKFLMENDSSILKFWKAVTPRLIKLK